MPFFTGWLNKIGGADGGATLIGDLLRMRGIILATAADALDIWRSNGSGAALVSIADSALPAGAATAALQSALTSLVATPTTPTAITKSDATDTTTITAKGILVGGAGNVVVRGVGSTTDVTIAAVAGQYIPLQSSRVMAATTATGLVGLS